MGHSESCRLPIPETLSQILNTPLKQETKPDTEVMPTVTATKDAEVQLDKPSSDHPVFQFEWNTSHRYATSYVPISCVFAVLNTEGSPGFSGPSPVGTISYN